jgi:sn-glycerol 3-phosphate transport system substrate-binding protein
MKTEHSLVRRILTLALMLCFVCSMTVSTSSAASEKVVLNFWHSMSGGTGKALDTIIQAFNDSQDQIEVVATYQGEYATALALTISSFTAGNAPDFLMGGSEDVTVLSTEEGVLENFLPYLEAQDSKLKLADFYEGFIMGYYNKDKGVVFALPMGCSTPVLYCNKTLLDKAGIGIPETWDELRDASKKIIAEDVSNYGIALPFNQWFFWGLINSWGGTVFTDDYKSLECVNDGSALAAYTFLQDMAKEGTLYAGPQADSSSVCTAMFSSGEAAFYINSIAQLNACEKGTMDNGYVLELAAVPKKISQAVPSGGNSVVMLSSSKNPDAAWTFIEWLYTSEMGIAYLDAQSGYLASTSTIKATKTIQDKIAADPNYAKA